jgi:hypothetical protein
LEVDDRVANNVHNPIREKQEEKSNNNENPSFEQKSVYPKKGKPSYFGTTPLPYHRLRVFIVTQKLVWSYPTDTLLHTPPSPSDRDLPPTHTVTATKLQFHLQYNRSVDDET